VTATSLQFCASTCLDWGRMAVGTPYCWVIFRLAEAAVDRLGREDIVELVIRQEVESTSTRRGGRLSLSVVFQL